MLPCTFYLLPAFLDSTMCLELGEVIFLSKKASWSSKFWKAKMTNSVEAMKLLFLIVQSCMPRWVACKITQSHASCPILCRSMYAQGCCLTGARAHGAPKLWVRATKGAFVWDQSGIRIIGIMQVSVCLGAILILEYLDSILAILLPGAE